MLDNLIYCGLLGQIAVGVAWSQASFLDANTENGIVQLGYSALTLLIYEGNQRFTIQQYDLSNYLRHRWTVNVVFFLKATLALSIAVAIIRIGLLIALSFTIQELARASPLQAFSAGAALCSTSLGTTFTILGTSGLANTRLGTVLTTAAMLDDVVGLIMVQVISNLGTSAISFNSITFVRPIVVSVGLVIVLLLACRVLLGTLIRWLNVKREKAPTSILQRVVTCHETAFLVHTATLLGLVTGATCAGTLNLFAAYLAGASISWWDSEVPHKSLERDGSMVTPVPENTPADPPAEQTAIVRASNEANTESVQTSRSDPVEGQNAGTSKEGNEAPADRRLPTNDTTLTGKSIYRNYYGVVVDRMLKPFFFVSKGRNSTDLLNLAIDSMDMQ